MTDTEIIDWLERYVNEHSVLVLHDGNVHTHGLPGLGLRPGFLNRTLREAVEQAAKYASPNVAEITDTEMLDWLARSGACMAFSKDGDDCWLHWPYDPNDEEGKAFNQKGVFDSVRDAIRAAMRES